MDDHARPSTSADAGAGSPSGGGRSATSGRLEGGLLKQKVTVPERAPGYFDRPDLVAQCAVTERRITVLKAPGGFGKTTLLAESCRRLVAQGVATAWLSLDEHDSPTVLDNYLVHAFQQAGVDVLASFDSLDAGRPPPEHRTALVAWAIEAHGSPCVLALDQVERVGNPESLSLLNFLLQRAPSNLHLAISCRELPRGLDIAASVLEGPARTLTVEQLRFSRAEVARFFDLRLSRRELAEVAEESAGWPIALCIYRNERTQEGLADRGTAREFAGNWVDSRLWHGLAAGDRDFLLDIGLFEWVDAALLGEVLDIADARRRIESMPALVGLLQRAGGAPPESWRLHPLVKEHCARRRYQETPDRFRSIHRRIAQALERRGQTTAAMRHADEAGDQDLIGQIVENAGGLRIWLRDGLPNLQAAVAFVGEEVRMRYPRAALAQCAAMVLEGRLGDAGRILVAIEARFADDEDPEFLVDLSLVHGLMALVGSVPLDSPRVGAILLKGAAIADSPETDGLVRGAFEYGMCLFNSHQAKFADALAWARRARDSLGGESAYLGMMLDLECGSVAMAQGRVAEAATAYARAQRAAKTDFLRDPVSTAIVQVYMWELDLERNGLPDGTGPEEMPAVASRGGAALSHYAAAAGVVTELKRDRHGIDSTLEAIGTMRDYARRSELPALARYLAASAVSYLAEAGRVAEAEGVWREMDLPETSSGCLDLEAQSWREMEAVASARVRLLAAGDMLDASRELAGSLVSLASDRGLRRTAMRGLAFQVRLAQQCGDLHAADRHCDEYLRYYDECDFARPLIREGDSAQAALRRFLDARPECPAGTLARRLLDMWGDPGEQVSPEFSGREIHVLELLVELQDKQIAKRLDISPAGVRYHLRKIFRKLGVRTRAAAVQRARSIGLLPEA